MDRTHAEQRPHEPKGDAALFAAIARAFEADLPRALTEEEARAELDRARDRVVQKDHRGALSSLHRLILLVGEAPLGLYYQRGIVRRWLGDAFATFDFLKVLDHPNDAAFSVLDPAEVRRERARCEAELRIWRSLGEDRVDEERRRWRAAEWHHVGMVAIQEGRPREGVACLAGALVHAPRATTLYYLGRGLLGLGHAEWACECLRRVERCSSADLAELGPAYVANAREVVETFSKLPPAARESAAMLFANVAPPAGRTKA